MLLKIFWKISEHSGEFPEKFQLPKTRKCVRIY